MVEVPQTVLHAQTILYCQLVVLEKLDFAKVLIIILLYSKDMKMTIHHRKRLRVNYNQ